MQAAGRGQACTVVMRPLVTALGCRQWHPSAATPPAARLSQPLQATQGRDARRQLPQRVEAKGQLFQCRELANNLRGQVQVKK